MRSHRSIDERSWMMGLRRLAHRLLPGASSGLPMMNNYDAIRWDHLHATPDAEHHAPRIRETLPAFIERAKEDEAVRQALARMGYRRVRAAHLRQKRESDGSGQFLALQGGHSPSLEFVEDWLKEERKRIRAQVRSTFLIAMMSAIGAGLGFAVSLMILG